MEEQKVDVYCPNGHEEFKVSKSYPIAECATCGADMTVGAIHSYNRVLMAQEKAYEEANS